jgi:hypothetical protein
MGFSVRTVKATYQDVLNKDGYMLSRKRHFHTGKPVSYAVDRARRSNRVIVYYYDQLWPTTHEEFRLPANTTARQLARAMREHGIPIVGCYRGGVDRKS